MTRMVRLFLIWVVCISLASASDDSSSEHQQNKPGWDPKANHPCTIEQISLTDFTLKYGHQGGLPPLFPRPIIITNSNNANKNKSINKRNQQFQNLTRSDSILHSFPQNFTVTLSSSNSFSEHRRIIPLASYLKEVNMGPTNPNMKSNENWYLFGETYSTEWKHLLRSYEVPPCQACDNKFDENLIALSFGIGNSGSGVQWHVHGPGFSEAIHGRKHWILYPPEHRPDFHPDQTSLNWMYYNYSIIKSIEDRPLECTLSSGDILYFPNMWWHATVNVDDYTAFVSTFTQEHLFVETKQQRIIY
jgi:hypothetical protein